MSLWRDVPSLVGNIYVSGVVLRHSYFSRVRWLSRDTNNRK